MFIWESEDSVVLRVLLRSHSGWPLFRPTRSSDKVDVAEQLIPRHIATQHVCSGWSRSLSRLFSRLQGLFDVLSRAFSCAATVPHIPRFVTFTSSPKSQVRIGHAVEFAFKVGHCPVSAVSCKGHRTRCR